MRVAVKVDALSTLAGGQVEPGVQAILSTLGAVPSTEGSTLPAAPVFAGAMRTFTLISDSGVEQAEPGLFTPHGKRGNEVLS